MPGDSQLIVWLEDVCARVSSNTHTHTPPPASLHGLSMCAPAYFLPVSISPHRSTCSYDYFFSICPKTSLRSFSSLSVMSLLTKTRLYSCFLHTSLFFIPLLSRCRRKTEIRSFAALPERVHFRRTSAQPDHQSAFFRHTFFFLFPSSFVHLPCHF